MRKTRKKIAIIVLLLCVLMLAGFGKKKVELLNSTQLIDLDAAIKEAPIGGQGDTVNSQENKKETEDVTPTTEKTNENTFSKELDTLSNEEKTTHVISVKDMEITYDNIVYEDINVLKKKIIGDCSNGDSVHLVDEFAEANTYRDVLAVLEQLHESMGLEYSYD